MNKIFVISCFAFFMFVPFARAETPPVPERKVLLPEIEQSLEIEQSQKAKLEGDTKKVEGELEDLREKLVKSGQDVQSIEKNLIDVEKRIEELLEEETGLRDKLDQQKKSFARLALALQKIARIPPQAFLGNPDAPLKAAQSHIIIRSILPEIQERAAVLKKDLERLQDVRMTLKQDRDEASARKLDLEKERGSLQKLVDQKQNIYRQANQDLKAQEELVQRISLKARTVKDLVEKIQQSQDQVRSRSIKQKAGLKTAASLPKMGNKSLPIMGPIVVQYDQTDGFGTPSQGLSIQGRENALITAPMGGVVEFAGFFKNYGNIVILEHQNKYHSLIAGFEKIDTLVGQSVAAGEPLGRLHKSIGGKQPKLYYELRQNGKPINPLNVLGSSG